MVDKKLNDLFLDMLKDIYFAERQILKNLPKMAKAAKSAELKKAFLTHRDQTEQHVERLQEVFEVIGRRPQAKTCEAIKGILEEGEEIMEEYAAARPWTPAFSPPPRRLSTTRCHATAPSKPGPLSWGLKMRSVCSMKPCRKKKKRKLC